MQARSLFGSDNPVAQRQPKTDRLILGARLRSAAVDKRLIDDEIAAAHEILIRWADLEKSGKLARKKESQLQGEFLAQVFGDALGYVTFTEGADLWHLDREHRIAGKPVDGILGFFRDNEPKDLRAVIELKGPAVHLDRDRSDGRTAVDQCWDYLVNTSTKCRWGIVSNMVSFRLYERDSTKRAYEHFTLQELRDPNVFRQFYVLFRRQGLVDKWLGSDPHAAALLKESRDKQREVGEKLYDAYSEHRTNLISYLHFETEQKYPIDEAIEMAQRLFDRIIFIAFCEDRKLLADHSIRRAYEELPGFYAVTNPRWQNFKNLFRFIDEGNETHKIPKYNGGLFAKHPVDDLELPDKPWTNFFKAIGGYDFADEVNLDVLGHLFERSITELEKLKESGLFGGDKQKAQEFAQMPQSAKRKQLGIYYTPPELTSRIVQYTVEELIQQRFAAAAVNYGINEEDAARGIMPDDAGFWRDCLGILRRLKIVDPACGSGAFLFQAYDVLELRYNEVIGQLRRAGEPDAEELASEIPRFILQENLYGVDLSPEAVEITQLALWIRSADREQTLAKLSENIVHGNSLVHDPEVHPAGFDWRERFPEVFDREEAGFDCVIGNPPWERIKLQEREFFSLPAPEIATATNAAKRRKLVAKLESADPELYQRYEEALASANALLTYCRKSKEYPLTGKGDINLYAVFAELATKLVSPIGRVGLLTPSGIASDKTTKDFFANVAESNRLIRLFDFENRLKKLFAEVDGRFKFCILNFGGSQVSVPAADFVFFAHKVEDLEEKRRHILLSGDDIKLLNPNTRTCPIFRTNRDAEITKGVYRRVPVLIDHSRTGPTANPWGVKFVRMFDQTNDAELFHEAVALKDDGFKLTGNVWKKGKSSFVPVYEAKMLQAYDHRAADIITDQSNWVRQGQTGKRSLVDYHNPEHLAIPRFWTETDHVEIGDWGSIGFKDITSPTNQRTMIAAFAPAAGFTNHFVLVRSNLGPIRQTCLLSNLNSVSYDYVVRQKIGGVTLNFFIVEQVPMLSPDTYDKPCPWDRQTTLETWISERVLKLTCTAEDMLPLADACGFTSGSFQREYGGRLNKWDEEERAVLTAELDAAYFHLYGINRDDAEYILSTFKGIHDRRATLPGQVSTAEFILQKYDELAP